MADRLNLSMDGGKGMGPSKDEWVDGWKDE